MVSYRCRGCRITVTKANGEETLVSINKKMGQQGNMAMYHVDFVRDWKKNEDEDE